MIHAVALTTLAAAQGHRRRRCRFTRNFQMFFTQFGIEGWLLVAQVLCAQAMLQPKSEIKWALSLFFRCVSPLPLDCVKFESLARYVPHTTLQVCVHSLPLVRCL